MSINVKNSTNKANQASSSKTGASAKSGKGSSSAKAPQSQPASEDSVSLTSTAARLQQIEQSLNEIPVVDSARVDSISQSIDDGQYQINDDKIADRIIKSESAIHELKKTS
ncbi:flagellar biosynthesis anti-sigma factor FlgM [Cycloclasticus sp. 46_120_T64]|nr:flagellar biosynthesis anti-sigma factor FlgM [Cycloclasticus sp. 46_120_T64]